MSLSFPFLLLALLLPSFVHAQIGTAPQNVSSNSTQLSYVGTWRSTLVGGRYEAYSNESSAAATFNFTGVSASYIAIKKANRGLFLLRLDGERSYTVDLYDDSGYAQAEAVAWESPILPYGTHNVTIQQIGPDARFGYYPYLFSETWVEVVPTNLNSYLATQVVASTTVVPNPTSSAAPSPSSSSPNASVSQTPAIVGGAIGGFVALLLALLLVFFWRRDRRNRSRGAEEIPQVKKGEGKMVIEDQIARGGGGGGGPPEHLGYNNDNGYYGGGNGQGLDWVQQARSPGNGNGYGGGGGGYPMSEGTSRGMAPSFHSSSNGYANPNRYAQSQSPSHQGYPYENRFGSSSPQSHVSSPQPLHPPGNFSVPNSPVMVNYDEARGGGNGSFPYHVQGVGAETRRFPVPEI